MSQRTKNRFTLSDALTLAILLFQFELEESDAVEWQSDCREAAETLARLKKLCKSGLPVVVSM